MRATAAAPTPREEALMRVAPRATSQRALGVTRRTVIRPARRVQDRRRRAPRLDRPTTAVLRVVTSLRTRTQTEATPQVRRPPVRPARQLRTRVVAATK